MITLIIPTRNRAYALKEVLDNFYSQEKVREIILVDDASDDDTQSVFDQFARKYPEVNSIYRRNEFRQGASFGRQEGARLASHEYVLFCDDDEFLQPRYASKLMEKIVSGKADIVSGRHLYREIGESLDQSINRFGKGLIRNVPMFNHRRFMLNTDAYMEEDTYLPFTHGIFMTTKTLLMKIGFDPYYRKGNGFREESDFQINAFAQGYKVLMTNEVYCVHMNMAEVKTGGQRTSRLLRYYWTIYYTNYFYAKYFDKVRAKLNIWYPRHVAIAIFSMSESYVFFVRPFFKLPGYIWKKLGH